MTKLIPEVRSLSNDMIKKQEILVNLKIGFSSNFVPVATQAVPAEEEK